MRGNILKSLKKETKKNEYVSVEAIPSAHMNFTVDLSLLGAQVCVAVEKNENGGFKLK